MKKFRCSVCCRKFDQADHVRRHAIDKGDAKHATAEAIPLVAKAEQEEENETSAMWRDLKQIQQQKRASNREGAADILTRAGVKFVSKNGGAHLIVDDRVDAWPGTGLWHSRNTPEKNRGVRSLLRFQPL